MFIEENPRTLKEGEMSGAETLNRLRAVNAQLLAALEEAQPALLSAILFIEGAFPEPRSELLKQELTSYRMRELKARAAIEGARK